MMYSFILHGLGTTKLGRNDVRIQTNNIKYTLDAVELAKRLGCKKFIGAGSQAEYGRVQGVISELTETKPDVPYGAAKLSACHMSRILANQIEIEHIWPRIFSSYGPYDTAQTMVTSSIRSMLEEKISPAYTKGEQTWDYIFSRDVAKAYYLIAEKGKNNSIYCIGNGQPRQLREFIEEIRNQINQDIELKLGEIEYSKNQVMNLSVDISKLCNDTGFVPEIDFKEGIKRTINWYKNEMMQAQE